MAEAALAALKRGMQDLLDSGGINLSAVYAALEKAKDNYFVDSWANAARVGEEAGAKGGGHGCREGGLSEAAVRYKRAAEEEALFKLRALASGGSNRRARSGQMKQPSASGGRAIVECTRRAG